MADPAEFEERDDLSSVDRQHMVEGSRMRAALVHEVIREEGEDELARSVGALAWSGLAAGLSMGFSLVVQGLLHHHLPDAPWRPLVESFGYTTGFVIVVLGRQQLFTENTLTGVIPALTRRDRPTFVALVRLWSVVLLANLIGTGLFAMLAANAPIFEPNLHEDFLSIGRAAAEGGFVVLFVKAVLAGWLIALMVWLLPGAGSASLIVILLITYIVALGGFSHIIAGSVDVLYLTFSGEKSFLSYLIDFVVPVLIGNIVGGSALVAVLNHAQVRGGGRLLPAKSGHRRRSRTTGRHPSSSRGMWLRQRWLSAIAAIVISAGLFWWLTAGPGSPPPGPKPFPAPGSNPSSLNPSGSMPDSPSVRVDTRPRPGWRWSDTSKAYATHGFSAPEAYNGLVNYCCDTAQYERVCPFQPSPPGEVCSCPNVEAVVNFETCQ